MKVQRHPRDCFLGRAAHVYACHRDDPDEGKDWSSLWYQAPWKTTKESELPARSKASPYSMQGSRLHMLWRAKWTWKKSLQHPYRGPPFNRKQHVIITEPSYKYAQAHASKQHVPVIVMS